MYKTDITILEHLFENRCVSDPPLVFLHQTYEKKEPSHVRDADVEEEGRIRINTAGGENVTEDAVLKAINVRDICKKAAQRRKEKENAESVEVQEGRAAIPCYVELNTVDSTRESVSDTPEISD